ncbi:Rho-associated protein kinase 1 [Anas platyrhynchos]|uniref:Rho-associated protein kinase 1 n=1 Tax=Anas platyrhynchos TaxID=8839 RepID=R0LSS3_ANAPL|nr:Rho-associated protein kinase 1 [Anas platyrhynchos]
MQHKLLWEGLRGAVYTTMPLSAGSRHICVCTAEDDPIQFTSRFATLRFQWPTPGHCKISKRFPVLSSKQKCRCAWRCTVLEEERAGNFVQELGHIRICQGTFPIPGNMSTGESFEARFEKIDVTLKDPKSEVNVDCLLAENGASQVIDLGFGAFALLATIITAFGTGAVVANTSNAKRATEMTGCTLGAME